MTEPERAHNDPPSDPLDDDTRRRRLLFRATHRGTYENDLLLGGFVRDRLDTLTAADIEALEALMDLPDPDLADWLTGRRPIPEDAPPMLPRIRASLIR
jgi:antitoxin CptB